MTSAGYRVILAAIIVAFGCGPATAEVTGDLELLPLVAKRHRANKDALRTWRGSAVVREFYRGNENHPQSKTEAVEFVLDRARGSRRWVVIRSGGVFMRENDPTLRPMPTKEHRGLVHNDLFVELQPFEVKGGRPRRVSLHEPRHARELRGPLGTFDPMDQLENVQRDLAAWVTSFHAAAATMERNWSVTRKGDLVTIALLPDGKPAPGGRVPVSRHVVDLSQGASLVSFVCGAVGEFETEFKYEYEQVGKLWILKSNSCRRFKFVDGRRELAKSEFADFSNSRINEPVEASEFTWAAVGIPKDATVTDMRPGPSFRAEWIAGEEAENHPNLKKPQDGL